MHCVLRWTGATSCISPSARICRRLLCSGDSSVLVSWSNQRVTVGAPPRTLVEGLDLEVREGDRWAVLGANGCGKSTVARQLSQAFAAEQAAQGAPVAGAEYISFETHRQLLLKELKEFRESRFDVEHKRATIASYLFPHLYPPDPAYPNGYDGYRPARTRLAPLPVPFDAEGDHPLLAELEAAVCAGETAQLLQQFDLLDARHRPVFGLSTGQLRKLMLAGCLLSPPRLLVLDEAFDGLDKESRRRVMLTLEELLTSTLVMITHRAQDLLFSPTHALLLGQGPQGTGYKAGPWSEMRSAAEETLSVALSSAQPSAPGRLRDKLPPRREPGAADVARDGLERPPLVEFRDVTIRYAEKAVFDRLCWTVREGENWVVLGRNGSGKSTLIDLITGDNVLAYQQDITLFDRRKGSGESVWDIKRQLGVISTGFHMEYASFADPSNRWYARTHSRITTWEVVCSGFFDSIGLYEDVGASQRDAAQEWVDRFGLDDLVAPPSPPGGAERRRGPSRDFFHLSFGQQKLVLLCRAMVKRPRLLLLDEPTHGLSGFNRGRLLHMLDVLAGDPSVAVVHVTHRQDEIEELGFRNVLRL